eukprot:TRINITY_DN7439_c0_g1_i2.p3 TRINITY_DN7439_c0_g1~~TRINITY_DN7439_c0_g1_i2.p3  ORF type:complete len:806 (-),score=291.93 TRINITY_DN7439_c0_g1_i2:305-2722(-)
MATSNWKGLPGCQPMQAAVLSARAVWAQAASRPPTPGKANRSHLIMMLTPLMKGTGAPASHRFSQAPAMNTARYNNAIIATSYMLCSMMRPIRRAAQPYGLLLLAPGLALSQGMSAEAFPFGPNARPILERRYLARDDQGRLCETPEQMLERVARAVARGEEDHGGAAAARDARMAFLRLMGEGLFLPNSPTLMNAGRTLGQLSACFVIPVADSLESIFEAVKETALIHKSGGGTGFSFSRLRPAGDVVASTHGISSGPLSFMQVFDMATEAVKQGGTRRGANMGLLAVSHPDIENFIIAKRLPGRLENFNISVMVSDQFMAAATAGAGWELINPRNHEVVRIVEAGALLERMVGAAHGSGEPGLAFYQAINQGNPTPELGPLEATNPCGEQPLLPHESCNLGSLVLPRFIRDGAVDFTSLEQAAALAVRFLDDVVSINRFPLPAVERATLATRKIGLGVMGLADLLVDLGLPYGSEQAVKLGGEIMARIAAAAREASADLGRTRGSFPAFQASRLAGRYKHMRNATVTTVAPTGTLSLLRAGASGIEPYFALAYTRRVLEGTELVEYNPRFLARMASLGLDTPDNRRALAAAGTAQAVAGLPSEAAALFPTAHQVTPAAHLAMQAAFQASTDNGVSKTVNLPSEAAPQAVKDIFVSAHGLGLKGVTVFRSGSRGRQVLELLPLPGQEAPPAVRLSGHCPRCGGLLKTDGGCLACSFCGASGCEQIKEGGHETEQDHGAASGPGPVAGPGLGALRLGRVHGHLSQRSDRQLCQRRGHGGSGRPPEAAGRPHQDARHRQVQPDNSI